ncbi:MAG: hypothetical protein INR68_06635 [Methylobacterium mesophilicum]|nr:hypothetical protein [Methylobacterium mesophilicum]
MKNHRNSLGELTATEGRNANKADTTTRVANDIMRAERKASDDKIARLKAARLARDAAEPAPAAKPRSRPKAAKKTAVSGVSRRSDPASSSDSAAKTKA